MASQWGQGSCVGRAPSYPTLCNPIDCSTPGSSVHGFSRQEHRSTCTRGQGLPNLHDIQKTKPDTDGFAIGLKNNLMEL